MKKLIISAGLYILSNMAFVTDMQAQNPCTKKEPGDVCPLAGFDRCFGSNPFDPKVTGIGDAACDALRNANKMGEQFEKSLQSSVNDLKKDMDAFVKVVGKDAVNASAIARYREANALMKQIDDELKGILTDKKYGVNGRLKAIKSFFETQGKNIIAVAGIASSFGDAIKEVLPVATEGAKITGEMSKIAASVSNASPEAKKQFDIIKTSMDGILKNIKVLASLDANGVVKTGADLVTTVGPFTGNCVACAGVIVAGVDGMAAGGTLTATTAACPESAGITCITGAAGVITTAASGMVSSIVASIPCQEMAKQANKMEEYFNSITKFVNAVADLAEDTQANLDKTEKAVQALNKLALQLKDDNKQSVKNIGLSINKIADDLEAGLKILETKTLPQVNKFGTSMLSQLSTNVNELVDCFNKYSSVAVVVTKDALGAAADLAIASATLVDGRKIFDNIITQSGKGVDRAEDYIKDRKAILDKNANDLNRSLFGVDIGKVDVGKTVQTLTGIAAKSDPVKFLTGKGKDAIDLIADYGNLVANALAEGKKSFLDLDRAKANCKKKTDDALPFAIAAEKKITAALASRKIKLPGFQVIATPLQLKIKEATFVTQKITRAVVQN